jgi:L-ascorbate metabolism protein UlaG (beta-lactamase superfamily)
MKDGQYTSKKQSQSGFMRFLRSLYHCSPILLLLLVQSGCLNAPAELTPDEPPETMSTLTPSQVELPALTVSPEAELIYTETPSLAILATSTATSTILPTSTRTPVPEPAGPPTEGVARVTYLGANGWGVQINDKFLIFDYQERTDPNPPTRGEVRNLSRGYIDLGELSDFDIYVFVTHSHFDHYDRVIYTWVRDTESITYFFGWEAGNDPAHHYLIGPRASVQLGDMEVYTINSHHSDVPEVAYLVMVDGYTIYHNGDYKQNFYQDFAYLNTITDHIDIAFVIGHPVENHQYFQQAELMAEKFQPTYMFAMNREGEAYRCQEFAELLVTHNVESTVLYGDVRGDSFDCPKMDVE